MAQKIIMKLRIPGSPGWKEPYPFKKLRVGDELWVPDARVTDKVFYISIMRFLRKNPDFAFAPIEKMMDGDLLYRVIRRTE